MEKIKLVIADDSDFVRDGLRIILDLDEDFKVVGCAKDGIEAVELCVKNEVDIVLMDLQMPNKDGIEATKDIVQRGLGKVLVLTTFDDYDLVEKAIQNGAKGYLIKNHTPEKLKQVIKSVYNGVNVIEESVFEKITQKAANMSGTFDDSIFTERELDIIRAVADGLSNKDIAAKLFISEGTVKNHISNILEKSNLSHRTQIAVYYLTGKRGRIQ